MVENLFREEFFMEQRYKKNKNTHGNAVRTWRAASAVVCGAFRGDVGTWRAASVSGVAPRFMITPHVCHNLFNRGNRMCEMTDAARDVRTA